MPSVLIDFSDVPSLDSRGLSWLLDTSDECRRRGGRLRLCCVGELCADLLRVTGVAAAIECVADQTAALASDA
jgi:anti-anti-sigma factor